MNKTKKYIGTLALGAVILTAPGCSDTWDEHYLSAEDETTGGTETLWQKIQSNPNLSKFASIVKASRYYKDEQHPLKNNATGEDFTYDQLLDGTQVLTVWAPENEAFTEDSYNQWMDLAKTNGYNVQMQLIANSIALWRNTISTGTIDTLRMLNGKIAIFDQQKETMAGLPLSEKNISASNGTLHTTKTLMPFNFNLYEYIKDGLNASANNINLFHNHVLKTDTVYFNENASLEGKPDENGLPIYVDSVYTNTNTMFFGTHRHSITNPEKDWTARESFGANIQAEDSVFAMIIPTDVAWQTAKDMLAPLYKYANNYVDNVKVNRGATGSTRTMTDEEIDSLTQMNLDMDIISPLCLNINLQPNAAGRLGVWDADKFIAEQGASAKYFLNTFGDTLRTDDNWEKSNMLNGTKIKMSNGYGILTDQWNIPAKLYKPDLYVEANAWNCFNSSDNSTTQGEGSPASYGFTNKTTWCKETGYVSKNNFSYIWNKSTTTMPVNDFRLVGSEGENRESEVMSGTYDIKVVMVPNYYMTSNDTAIVLTVGSRGSGAEVSRLDEKGKEIKDENGKVVKDTIPVKHRFTATINYCNNDLDKGVAKDKSLKSGVIEYDGTKVDTITVFENFTFPYSYKNLNNSYPTLRIVPEKLKSADTKAGYTIDFCIDQIILVSKDDNVTAVKAVRKDENN